MCVRILHAVLYDRNSFLYDKSMGFGGPNAVSRVFIRQKLVSAAQFEFWTPDRERRTVFKLVLSHNSRFEDQIFIF